MEQRVIKRRRRIKHQKTFQERLAEEAARFKQAANDMPPSTARELLLKRARQAETAAHIDEWLSSPGLRPPTEAGTFLHGKTKAEA